MELAGIAPLGVDACRSDTTVPCFYWHTKRAILRGESVPTEARIFAGFDIPVRVNGRGWHYPSIPPAGAEDDGSIPDADPELVEMLRTTGTDHLRWMDTVPEDVRRRRALTARLWRARKKREAAATR